METHENWEDKWKSVLENAEIEVSTSLWGNIEKELPNPRRKRFVPWHNYSSVAAVILVLFGVGIWWFADQRANLSVIEEASKWNELKEDILVDSQAIVFDVVPKVGKVEDQNLELQETILNHNLSNSIANKVEFEQNKAMKTFVSQAKKSNSDLMPAKQFKNTNQSDIAQIVRKKHKVLDPIEHKVVLDNNDFKMPLQKIENKNNEDCVVVNDVDIVVVTDFKVLEKPIRKVIAAQEALRKLIDKVLPKKDFQFEFTLGKTNK